MRAYLKDLREERHLTQIQLAKSIGLSQSYYAWIESGNRQKNITLDTLFKLSEALAVPIETLISSEKAYKTKLTNYTGEREKVNNIASIRKSKGFTQKYVAYELKIDRSTVAMWETGKSLPRTDKLPSLAKILGCTVDELLGSDKKTG